MTTPAVEARAVPKRRRKTTRKRPPTRRNVPEQADVEEEELPEIGTGTEDEAGS